MVGTLKRTVTLEGVPSKKARTMPRYGRASYMAVKPEMKYKDFVLFNAAGIAAGATPQFQQLTNIAQGADRFERVGRRISIRKVEMRGAADQPAEGGIDIHLWSPRATSDPVLSDFTGGVGSFATDTGYSWFHYTQVAGIIPNSTVRIGTPGNGVNLNCVKYFPKGLLAYYNGIAGTNCDRNKLYFVVINNSNAACTVLNYCIRIWYYDL